MNTEQQELLELSLNQLKSLISQSKDIQEKDIKVEFIDSFFGFSMTRLHIEYKFGNYTHYVESRNEITDRTVNKWGIDEYELKMSLIRGYAYKLKVKGE
jgi:hypothetical protein